MKLLKTSIENISKKQVYQLTKTSGINAKDACDREFAVQDWALYEETNSRGEDVEVLSILTDSDKLVTISGTFKDAFFEIVDIMGDDPFSIVVKTGKTRAGRDYCTCEMVC